MPPTSRRGFLTGAAGVLASPSLAAPRGKAPFKVLFSNDTTNILTCASPYHPAIQDSGADVPRGWYDDSAGLTPAMIQGTVDEVAGVDAHMLQPGLGWIPWWKSKLYPADEHYRRWQKRTGQPLDGFGKFMVNGGDMVRVFIDRCRQRKQTPFISLRMNDGHLLDHVGDGSRLSVWSSRFYEEHPEYRLGPNLKSWDDHVLNWAIPEVREHKFSFIRELCENYDLDGFELDFMRHTKYFREKETTSRQRAQIITDMVARVRDLLDRTSRGGRRRWLCARVPCFLVLHDAMGIDLPAMAEAGLDMADLSAHYFTCQQTDLAKIRKLVPRASLYLEMTHATAVGPLANKAPIDDFTFMRTVDQQFYTGAHLAYQQGADGLSLFNFVYYREHGPEGRGPFREPPFHVLERLGQPAWLARQPQWYLTTAGWGRPAPHLPLPRTVAPGQDFVVALEMAPQAGREDGLLRLRMKEDAGGRKWEAKWNGALLAGAAYVEKPLPHPYVSALGEPGQYACFRVPRKAVRAGRNEIGLTLSGAAPAVVDYLDLILK